MGKLDFCKHIYGCSRQSDGARQSESVKRQHGKCEEVVRGHESIVE